MHRHCEQALWTLLIEIHTRNLERQQMVEQKDWDDEAEEEEKLEEAKEEELVSRVVFATGALLRMHGPNVFMKDLKKSYEMSDTKEAM